MPGKNPVILRQTEPDDLELFYQFQLDRDAIHLAAFTPKDPTDKKAYLEKYSRLLSNSAINMKTILYDNAVVGSVSKFEREGDAEITYWLDRNYWNKGLTTTALKTFLTLEKSRPIFGRVGFDNYPSQRVLEKCGFVKIGTDRGFANARQSEIEEFIYRLD